MALTETETFGTVVPGFVTDTDGNLAVAESPAETSTGIVHGFVTDTDGRLAVEVDPASASWDRGFLRTEDGYLAITATGTPEYGIVPGFASDAAGFLFVDAADSPTWSGGFLRNEDNSLSKAGA